MNAEKEINENNLFSIRMEEAVIATPSDSVFPLIFPRIHGRMEIS